MDGKRMGEEADRPAGARRCPDPKGASGRRERGAGVESRRRSVCCPKPPYHAARKGSQTEARRRRATRGGGGKSRSRPVATMGGERLLQDIYGSRKRAKRFYTSRGRVLTPRRRELLAHKLDISARG